MVPSPQADLHGDRAKALTVPRAAVALVRVPRAHRDGATVRRIPDVLRHKAISVQDVAPHVERKPATERRALQLQR